MHTPLSEMKAWNPSGYQLSNGPGDPSAMPGVVHTVKEILLEQKPVFGICLGHQVLAQACGISTYKMFNGHRGGNHPVKNLETGLCEITSQNHGFSVKAEDILNHPEIAVTHINLNDQTIEGIRLKNRPIFSVQYHPEANPGPHDSRYLFNQFVSCFSA
jgi:carbamoyl-phosphate synthase small subunit